MTLRRRNQKRIQKQGETMFSILSQSESQTELLKVENPLSLVKGGRVPIQKEINGLPI
jgi:hypothetical protein